MGSLSLVIVVISHLAIVTTQHGQLDPQKTRPFPCENSTSETSRVVTGGRVVTWVELSRRSGFCGSSCHVGRVVTTRVELTHGGRNISTSMVHCMT